MLITLLLLLVHPFASPWKKYNYAKKEKSKETVKEVEINQPSVCVAVWSVQSLHDTFNSLGLTDWALSLFCCLFVAVHAVAIAHRTDTRHPISVMLICISGFVVG